MDWDRPYPLMLEVQGHLDLTTVRAVALQATSGLSRGVGVRSTGAPIMVPVGRSVLGKLLGVTGEVRDLGEALADDVPRRSIHAVPPALAAQSSATDVY